MCEFGTTYLRLTCMNFAKIGLSINSLLYNLHTCTYIQVVMTSFFTVELLVYLYYTRVEGQKRLKDYYYKKQQTTSTLHDGLPAQRRSISVIWSNKCKSQKAVERTQCFQM